MRVRSCAISPDGNLAFRVQCSADFSIKNGAMRACPKLLVSPPLHEHRAFHSLREAHGIDCGVAHVPPAVCTAHHLGVDVDAFGRKAEEFCHFVPQAKWPLCRYVKIRPIFADIGEGNARANRSVRNVGNVIVRNETPRSSCKGCVNAGVTAQHSINWCCRSCDGPFPFDTERVNRGDRLLISLGHDADKVLVTHDRYYAWKSLRQAVIHSHKPAALYRRMQHLAPQHVRQADVTRVSSATCHDAESFKT